MYQNMYMNVKRIYYIDDKKKQKKYIISTHIHIYIYITQNINHKLKNQII